MLIPVTNRRIFCDLLGLLLAGLSVAPSSLSQSAQKPSDFPKALPSGHVYLEMKLVSVSDNTISGVSDQGKPFTVTVRDDAKVWRLTSVHGLSTLQPGDRLFVRLVSNRVSGQLEADIVDDDHVSYYGRIAKLTPNGFIYRAEPPTSPDRPGLQTVTYAPSVRIVLDGNPAGTSVLAPGALVRIVGFHEDGSRTTIATYIELIRTVR